MVNRRGQENIQHPDQEKELKFYNSFFKERYPNKFLSSHKVSVDCVWSYKTRTVFSTSSKLDRVYHLSSNVYQGKIDNYSSTKLEAEPAVCRM